MLFPEEDAPLLKAWIVKRIENTSDADYEVLAEYIIALLKHDGDKDSVRKLCEEEIPDFLTEDPQAFLNDVFQAIAYKSYLPGAPPPPKFTPNLPPPPQAPKGVLPEIIGAVNLPAALRKRGYHDLDAPGGQEAFQNGPRPMKNPRRGWRGVRGGSAGMGHGNFGAMGMPPFDPQNPIPMEAFLALGMPYPGMPPFPSGPRGGRSRRRGRCRDFDTKGYCSRGGTCPYDHGNESMYMPPMQGDGEYNPDNAMKLLPGQPDLMHLFPFDSEKMQGRGGRRGGRGQGQGRRGGARAVFSAEGPVIDQSKTTIVVENIPEESFQEKLVRDFFSQFGTILEISMQPYKHLAIVKYDKWDFANAAYRSPKAIFDNRFVKVFWFKDESHVMPPSAPNGSKFRGALGSEGDAELEIDIEEFKRKQEEAQKHFQEREARRMGIEQQRQELEQKQKELMEKHRQESEKLQAKLFEKNRGEPSAPSSGADVLRAKLEELEREAKILGIDPDADDASMSSWTSRGGYRGRGGFRARGRGFRGGRGNFRGGCGGGVEGRHAAYAQYSIDNRPKRLAISGVDFTAPDRDESLRHYLLNLGEFESVEPSASTTYVSFQDRKQAEKVYYSLVGRELPGVEGKLELQWVNNGPVPPQRTKDKENEKDKEDTNMMEGVGDMEEGEVQEQQVEVDYEPAGDDDAY